MILRCARFLILFAVIATASCAHYGYSNRHDVSVSVETVAVDGDSGLDPAALTRTMVSRLSEQGVGASWADDAVEYVATCATHVVDDGASGQAWSPRVVVRCRIGEDAFEAIGNAAASIETPSNDSIRDVQQAAATDAIMRVADLIAADMIGKEETDGQEE